MSAHFKVRKKIPFEVSLAQNQSVHTASPLHVDLLMALGPRPWATLARGANSGNFILKVCGYL